MKALKADEGKKVIVLSSLSPCCKGFQQTVKAMKGQNNKYTNKSYFTESGSNSNPKYCPFLVAGTPFFIHAGMGAPFR